MDRKESEQAGCCTAKRQAVSWRPVGSNKRRWKSVSAWNIKKWSTASTCLEAKLTNVTKKENRLKQSL